MSCNQDAMRGTYHAASHNPKVQGSPVWVDVKVRCCARDALRNGADPIHVAALLEVCVEDLDDVLAVGL